MVAPHNTGDLVRSLVRVPGSGTEKSAGSECLDLSKVSSLAASVRVPQTLPPVLATPKILQPQQLKSVNEKLETEQGLNAGIITNNNSRKRPCPSDSPPSPHADNSTTISHTNIAKKVRIQYMTKEEILNQPGTVVPINTPTGPILYLINPQTPTNVHHTLTSAKLTQIINERDGLREENRQMRQRLNLFLQLFKDKERLGRIVKRLGVC